jgi:outer membrane lipoprotein carrier protein
MRTLMLVAVFASVVGGFGSGVLSAVRTFEGRYQQTHTLKAIFFKSYCDGKGGVSADSGAVYFSRPGRMCREYQSPETKLFLVDGTNVWFYVPADRTVSRAKLSQSSDWRTPLALLAGKTDLSKLCRRIEPAAMPSSQPEKLAAPPGDFVLRCIPRESPESETIRSVLFEVSPEGLLGRLVIVEAGNATTEFRFSNWVENVENVGIPEVKFHFEPPPGVAVVDQQSLADTIR